MIEHHFPPPPPPSPPHSCSLIASRFYSFLHSLSSSLLISPFLFLSSFSSLPSILPSIPCVFSHLPSWLLSFPFSLVPSFYISIVFLHFLPSFLYSFSFSCLFLSSSSLFPFLSLPSILFCLSNSGLWGWLSQLPWSTSWTSCTSFHHLSVNLSSPHFIIPSAFHYICPFNLLSFPPSFLFLSGR